MQDRRKSTRRKTYLGGRVAFNDRQSTVDCVLKNVGAHGAKLSFTEAVLVPDEFDLELVRMATTFRARTVWRRNSEIGVSFVEEAACDETSMDLSLRLRKLNAENIRLRHRIAQLCSGI